MQELGDDDDEDDEDEDFASCSPSKNSIDLSTVRGVFTDTQQMDLS